MAKGNFYGNTVCGCVSCKTGRLSAGVPARTFFMGMKNKKGRSWGKFKK